MTALKQGECRTVLLGATQRLPRPASEPWETAYAAGLFEGEGSIQIRGGGRKARYCVVVAVKMTDPEPVSFFHERWDGSLRTEVPNPKPSGEPKKPFAVWTAVARVAVRFLADVLPYFQSERYQLRAQVALAFQAQKVKQTTNAQRLTYNARQRYFFEVMRALNRKGPDALSMEERRIVANLDAQLSLLAVPPLAGAEKAVSLWHS
jgi:hypothetical protein